MPMRLFNWLGLVALSFALATAHAQSYPTKPIKLIVPFGPGSGSDIVARRLGLYLQEHWKQSVVIDNRPGAQGMIGTEALKNAPADGHTLGISTNSTHAAAPYLIKNLPYDPIADFTHLALIGVGGSVALVPRQSPFKTLPALANFAKANPGKIFFGHADTSSLIPGELLKVSGNLPVEGVAYKASGNVVADLLGGQIHFAFFNYMTAAAQVAGGRLQPIAITEAKRNPSWPGIPAVNETYPGYEVTFFVGISAPRGVAPGIKAKIHQTIQDALRDPQFREPLRNIGLTFVPQLPGDYRNFIVKEGEYWRDLIKAAKLAPQ
jgi:tripartite-type tricarboxylate transporter receptor subunit TctC